MKTEQHSKATTPILSHPAAVIFDMDGCLVDSEPLCINAIVQILHEIGIVDVTADEIRKRFLGVSMRIMCAEVTGRHGRACPEDFVDRVENKLVKDFRERLRPINGVANMLAKLREQGIALAVATGASIRRMNDTLTMGGLADWFDGVAFSADQVERGKPAPDLFLLAAQELGVRPQDCIVLEDSPHGIEGARAAGMQAVGFVGGSHLDGMRDDQAAILKAKGAVTVAADMTHALEALITRGRHAGV